VITRCGFVNVKLIEFPRNFVIEFAKIKCFHVLEVKKGGFNTSTIGFLEGGYVDYDTTLIPVNDERNFPNFPVFPVL